MRKPKYLSPTSLSKWQSNQEDFFLDYCATDKPSRMPQTNAMSVGSAFDAFVKSDIASKLGILGYDKEELFMEQVETQNRDFAHGAGERCFAAYRDSGALASLMQLIGLATSEVKMEVSLVKQLEGVPLLGKPDLYFEVDSGDGMVPVIVDWKVNGYCSKSGHSPKAGYKALRHSPLFTGREAKTLEHKEYVPTRTHGIEHNCGKWFEEVDESWARQLSTYAWILGAPVEGKTIIAIEQLACGPKGIRCATHMGLASAAFQRATMDGYVELWDRLKREHIFSVDIEESRKMQHKLDCGDEADLIPKFGDGGKSEWREHSMF